MTKKILLLLLTVLSVNAYCQKGKKSTKVASAAKTVLAKSENLTAELLQNKDSYKFYLLSGKDSLVIKFISGKIENKLPADCKITPFTAKGTKLYSISWLEKSTVGDAKTKLENITETHTEIWDVANKAKVYDNVQTVNNITEIVWLDPNKTASKTQEKIRRDGFELTLTPEGDLLLKNKTQQDKFAYDPAQKKFVGKSAAKK